MIPDDWPIPRTTKRGNVFALGPHRLMCGDASDPTDVAWLMQGVAADLVVTSPPFNHNRHYSSRITDWDALMQSVFSAMPVHDGAQILVNLALIYKDCEWVEYYADWARWMSAEGWRRFGWYTWDKLNGPPGDYRGRLAPTHEWIFHFNRRIRQANKIVPKLPHNVTEKGKNKALRMPNGRVGPPTKAPETSLATHKIPDSVIRMPAEKRNGLARVHPAVWPVELPQRLMETWSDAGQIVYEPFAGSGSTILAAERAGRVCYAMELCPEYVDLAVARYKQEVSADGS